MPRSELCNKIVRLFLIISLISVISMSFAVFVTEYVEAQLQTSIGVSPSSVTVGNTNEVIPAAGLPFNVTLTVSDVTDLFAWQARIYFVPTIVNWTSVSYPAGYVFAGKSSFPIDPSYDYAEVELSENLTDVDMAAPVGSLWRWLQTKEFSLTKWTDMDNSGNLSKSDLVWLNLTDTGLEKYYSVKAIETIPNRISMTVEIASIQVGETLLGLPTFSGDGVLIQLGFKGIAVGESMLNLSRVADECFLLNSTTDGSDEIPFQMTDARVSVIGEVAGKEPSTITLDVSPSAVKSGSNVTLSGSITPTKANADVTIYQRLEAVSAWSVLATVKTNQQSQYTYTWTTSSVGNYELKAGWQGDSVTSGDESDMRTVTVTAEEPTGGPDYLPYIIGAIVIVIIAVVVVYFLMRRKR